MEIKIISTTTDSNETANCIARNLVKDKLSPCVQIVPNIQSIFTWKSKTDKSCELMILIKTIPEKLQDCKKLILKYHNYEVPEIVVTNGEILYDEYRDWFIDSLEI